MKFISNAPLFATLLLSIFASACTADIDESDALDHVMVDDASPPEHDITLTINGVEAPEQIIASLVTEDSTKLYFLQGEEDEQGHFAVDVVIVGRDGGRDYGALLGSDGVTPLELFVALAGQRTHIPAALQQAHDWVIQATRNADEEPRVPNLEVLTPVHDPGIDNNVTQTGLSTFTCLSWSNFNTFVGSVFSGAPGRAQVVDSNVNGLEVVRLPQAANSFYPTGRADLVTCNYNSGSGNNNPSDRINASACHLSGVFNPSEHCVNFQMWDGEYLRRIYGFQTSSRRYKASTIPVNGASLQSYTGIVRRN